MSANIKFYTGVQSEYDALGMERIDPNGIYFLSDSKSIMKNNIKYGSGDVKVATLRLLLQMRATLLLQSNLPFPF